MWLVNKPERVAYLVFLKRNQCSRSNLKKINPNHRLLNFLDIHQERNPLNKNNYQILYLNLDSKILPIMFFFAYL